MDPIALTREINVFYSLFLLLPALVYLILKHFGSPSLKRQSLPPGPHPWPIIGNILEMGKKPHISMARLAEVHGPLLSLRLGTQLVVVGSSAAAATEILKTQDRVLSGRYVPQVMQKSILLSPQYVANVTPSEGNDPEGFSIAWAPKCTDQWKFLRALCRAELFSAKCIDSQATLRERKVSEMVGYLDTKGGKVVKIGEVVFATIFNTLANLFFSKDFVSVEEEGGASGIKGVIWRLMELGVAPNIADLYPILGGLDLQGLTKQSLECAKKAYAVWEVLIKERRENRGHGATKPCDFLDVLLANEFTDDRIHQLLIELFSAGMDTTTTTVEWAMAELLKNKEVMNKVDEELGKINRNFITESDVSQLPYLHACVKETLRLHPPVPFLLHRAVGTCELMNYTIPKNSKVLVNLWAIGRDPSIWEDPLSFKPDRFLNSNLDFKGQDFEFIPFGAGRRMCPGLPMASKQAHLILASLIHCFEWSLPNGDDPAHLDMNEKFGITLQKEQPLVLIPNRKP